MIWGAFSSSLKLSRQSNPDKVATLILYSVKVYKSLMWMFLKLEDIRWLNVSGVTFKEEIIKMQRKAEAIWKKSLKSTKVVDEKLDKKTPGINPVWNSFLKTVKWGNTDKQKMIRSMLPHLPLLYCFGNQSTETA